MGYCRDLGACLIREAWRLRGSLHSTTLSDTRKVGQREMSSLVHENARSSPRTQTSCFNSDPRQDANIKLCETYPFPLHPNHLSLHGDVHER